MNNLVYCLLVLAWDCDAGEFLGVEFIAHIVSVFFHF